MSLTLPYLASNKNIPKLFETILSAQKPSTFTHEYLRNTVGLKGSNDRPLIPLLRTLGFIDTAGVPTVAYDLLKNKATASGAIAEGIKKAYPELFRANEKANALSSAELKGLLSQVSGADEKMVNLSARTFGALAKLADFAMPRASLLESKKKPDVDQTEDVEEHEQPDLKRRQSNGFRSEFHYNIQIHLPGNGTEETYLNIFNALRRTFK
jgi:hypothetical protein